MEINEIVEKYLGEGIFSDIGKKIGMAIISKGIQPIIKSLDAGEYSVIDYASRIDKMPTKDKENIKKAMDVYLSKNPHEKLQAIRKMI